MDADGYPDESELEDLNAGWQGSAGIRPKVGDVIVAEKDGKDVAYVVEFVSD